MLQGGVMWVTKRREEGHMDLCTAAEAGL